MSGSRDQNRIQPIDPDRATGPIERLFAEIRTKFALVPNLFRVLATAPAALEGLIGLGSALAHGALDEKIREQLALTIAESNLCPYCLITHTAVAAKIGLSRVEIDDAIRASAADARTDAILKLARSIVVQRGELTDTDLARARAVGLGDGEIVETVANVALNIFENYMSTSRASRSTFRKTNFAKDRVKQTNRMAMVEKYGELIIGRRPLCQSQAYTKEHTR